MTINTCVVLFIKNNKCTKKRIHSAPIKYIFSYHTLNFTYKRRKKVFRLKINARKFVYIRARVLKPSDLMTRINVVTSARVSFDAHSSRLRKHRSCLDEYCRSIRSISSLDNDNSRAICFHIRTHSSR